MVIAVHAVPSGTGGEKRGHYFIKEVVQGEKAPGYYGEPIRKKIPGQ
jgi:hypothetical protein